MTDQRGTGHQDMAPQQTHQREQPDQEPGERPQRDRSPGTRVDQDGERPDPEDDEIVPL